MRSKLYSNIMNFNEIFSCGKTPRCQSMKERSQWENLQGNSILRCHLLLRPLCKSLDIFNWIHVFKISILCLLSFQGIKYNTIQYEEKYVFNNFLTKIWLKGLNGWAGKAMYYFCKNWKRDLLVLLYTESKGCYFFCHSFKKCFCNRRKSGGNSTAGNEVMMLEAKHSFMYFCSFYWFSDIKVPLWLISSKDSGPSGQVIEVSSCWATNSNILNVPQTAAWHSSSKVMNKS